MFEAIGFFVIVLVMVIVIIRRQYLKHKSRTETLSGSANQLQLQMEKTADEIIQRMENQASHLEFLAREADEKILQLDAKIKRIEELMTELNAENDKDKNVKSNESELFQHPEKSCLEKKCEDKNSGHVFFQDEKRIVEEKEPVSKKKLDVRSSKVNRMVFDLMDRGYTIDEIAKQTGIGKGAILLIQEMYKLK